MFTIIVYTLACCILYTHRYIRLIRVYIGFACIHYIELICTQWLGWREYHLSTRHYIHCYNIYYIFFAGYMYFLYVKYICYKVFILNFRINAILYLILQDYPEKKATSMTTLKLCNQAYCVWGSEPKLER